jgi:resuscitation-promoting factor RpfA
MRLNRAPEALLGFLALVASSGLLLRLAWLPRLRWRGLGAALTSTSPDRSLPLVLVLALCCLCAWLALTVVVTLVAQLPGAVGRLASACCEHIAPVAMRRAVEVVLGVTTVLAASAGAAQAAPTSRPPVTQQISAVSPAPASLDRPATMTAVHVAPTFSLDRPATMTAVHVAPTFSPDPARGIGLVSTVASRTPAQQAKSAETVTVRRGDSLWRIAARSLPRGSSDAAIERAWHRWYVTNRAVVGPDPGLLQPGQQLSSPQP